MEVQSSFGKCASQAGGYSFGGSLRPYDLRSAIVAAGKKSVLVVQLCKPVWPDGKDKLVQAPRIETDLKMSSLVSMSFDVESERCSCLERLRGYK